MEGSTWSFPPGVIKDLSNSLLDGDCGDCGEGDGDDKVGDPDLDRSSQ